MKPSLLRASAKLHPRGSKRYLLRRLKFLLRAGFQPKATTTWLERINRADTEPLWKLHPRLASKLQRPYIFCHWKTPEKLASLLDHYTFLSSQLGAGARGAIFREGLSILRLSHAESNRQLELRVTYHDQFEKEGELTLSIEDLGSALALAGITFTFVRKKEQSVVLIGGLQASPDPRTRTMIHDIAKEMYGLRPKALVLWFLQEMAILWKFDRIQAIADDQHIYRHWRKRRDFAASYNEFWEESDGQRLPDGSWELPLQLRQRSREELKPSRRKAHERRYAMMAALRPLLRDRMQALTAVTAEADLEKPAEFVYSKTLDVALPTDPSPLPPGSHSQPSENPAPPPNHSY